MSRIISNPARVHDYVSRIMPMPLSEGMKGIGLERDGELVAGILYEGFNGHNMWAHTASHIPGAWMTRGFLRYAHWYPFMEAGVQRLSVQVRETNAPSKRLTERMGYKLEARLHGAASDGSDILLYVMWRDECPFIGERYG